jgi:hypothetical protein
MSSKWITACLDLGKGFVTTSLNFQMLKETRRLNNKWYHIATGNHYNTTKNGAISGKLEPILLQSIKY